jgi:tetratricopeptide (TPR) repeat protein
LNTYFIIIKTLNSKDALALWNMTLDQKREEAIRRKDKGNEFFKNKNFKKALKNYKKGISALDDFFKSTKTSNNKDGMLDDSTDSENDDIKHEPTENDEKLFVTLQSNAGMMCLKLKENKNALNHVSEGLKHDGNHMKC